MATDANAGMRIQRSLKYDRSGYNIRKSLITETSNPLEYTKTR